MTTSDELAAAYNQIVTGRRCRADVMAELGDDDKRRAELALNVKLAIARDGLPAQDVLHTIAGRTSDKAAVAGLLCPDYLDEWTPGGRLNGREAYQQRQQVKIDDRVLASVAALDPSDVSPAAVHLREVAASVRDHRESHWRRVEHDACGKEEQALEGARAAYAERDRLRKSAGILSDAHAWEGAGAKAADANRADKLGDSLIAEAIQHHNAAAGAREKAAALRAANDEYEQNYQHR